MIEQTPVHRKLQVSKQVDREHQQTPIVLCSYDQSVGGAVIAAAGFTVMLVC